MSASQDKKRRQAEREAGASPKTLAQREEEQKLRKEHRTWTIVGVIVALFIAVIVLLNTNLLYTGTTALTIGDEEYTNAEYQYYYNTAVNNFSYQYGSYASFIGVDFNSDLDDQTFDDSMLSMLGVSVPDSFSAENRPEDATWADYFRAVALDNMVQVTAIYKAAAAAGVTLSEEDAEQIDSTIATFESMAEQNNLRGADGYCAVVYGKGVDAELVRELLERAYVAEDYSAQVFDGFEYTQEELDSYYDEHADDFDALTLEYYLVEAEKVEVTETVTDEETGEETDETSEEVTDETMAEAKDAADAVLAAVEDGESLADAVAAEVDAEDAEPIELNNVFGYSISSGYNDAFADWVLDSARESGDATVIESEGSGYFVIVWGGRSDNTDYNGVAFRHILVMADDTDEDGTISEDEKNEAESSLRAIYDEWVEGGGSEELFATLADQYSEDSGSNNSSIYSTSGGIYEHVAMDQMVPEINDWIFDSARQPGDNEIIFVESSNYTGWHLVYFVGTDDYNYHDCLAQYGLSNTGAPQGLRQPDYDAWEAELLSGYSVKVNGFVNWFAKV